MRIYKNAMTLLYRSRILFIAILLSAVFVAWQTFSVYGSPIVTVPLGNAMTLSIYLFIIFMLISFEYMKKLYNNGVAETLLVTSKGKQRKNYWAGFFVMTTFSILISAIVAIIVLKQYMFYKIEDPNNEYKLHIIKSVILHDFFVMELAIIIGTALAIMKKRMVAYVIMTFFILATCPFATKIATVIAESCINGYGPARIAFKIISNFYIVPRFNMDYLPEAAFGESLLPDRFFIILFWGFFFGFIICITRKKYKKCSGLFLILSIAMLVGFHSPSIPKMSYGMDWFYGGDPNWLDARENKNKNKDIRAEYEITKYDMELSLFFSLSAKVDMKVSKSLDEYKMTLHKDYKVKSVLDQDGNKLDYIQDGNYLTIKNSMNNNITNIIIKYSGNNMSYYSNYQCCFLPGYFLYYPRAGYIPVTDETYGFVYYDFVDKDTEFNVKVEDPEKYISNLKLIDGQFRGKCDGFTLIKGFYKTKDLGNGNTLVYPYLDNFVIHDGKMSEEECWQENFEFSIEELEKDKVTDTLLFFDSTLYMEQGWAYGEKQYFIQSYPTSYMSLIRE